MEGKEEREGERVGRGKKGVQTDRQTDRQKTLKVKFFSKVIAKLTWVCIKE